ncbi:MAG: hypothetical protein Q8R47_02900 [Nanoarchaeota archaeon]|nr:hypothetical protein [Nanoarchaeota archaeon]
MKIPAELISNLLIPFFSLSGLLAGVFLSSLAQEELPAGKKYFILFYRFLFIFLSMLVSYFAYSRFPILTAAYLLFSVILITADLRKPSSYLFYAHYLFFLIGYFLSGKQLLVATLLFLYGLPIGTLLRMKE